MMIEAGTKDQVVWGDGNWVFLDIGFARDKRSSGLLIGDGEPCTRTFGEAQREIIAHAEKIQAILNLVIEAPLSVCFNSGGNPTGRSIEREGRCTRYWYTGPGAAVMVAAMYLVRGLQTAPISTRLFEGFISFKDRDVPSDDQRDVRLLREVVCDPDRFSECIISPESLRQEPCDKLFSAFCVAGMDCGVPAVIKRRPE